MASSDVHFQYHKLACCKASMRCCSRDVLCLLLQIIKKNVPFLVSTNSSFFQKRKQ